MPRSVHTNGVPVQWNKVEYEANGAVFYYGYILTLTLYGLLKINKKVNLNFYYY